MTSAPLTPSTCDLTDFPKLMIDIPRLFASGFNATASRNPLAWMIGHKLWYRSWHQVPAGSLPSDEDELCHLAELGFDTKSFNKAKGLAMRGWVLCDDGRLYHPVVCEAALEAWQEKLRQRLSSGKGNAKRWKVAFDPAPIVVELESLIACLERLNPQSKSIIKARVSLAGIADGVPVGRNNDPSGIETASQWDNGPPGILSQETGTGTEDKKDTDVSSVLAEPKAAKTSPRKSKTVGPEPFEAAWKAYPHVEGRSSKPNALTEWKGLGEDEKGGLLAAIQRFIPKVSQAHGDKGAPCMARWLKDGKHLNWMAGPSEPALEFNGPSALLASVVQATSEDFARKWITPCHWRAEDRTLVARNSYSAKQLSTELAGWLAENKVTVEVASEPRKEAA